MTETLSLEILVIVHAVSQVRLVVMVSSKMERCVMTEIIATMIPVQISVRLERQILDLLEW
jgi:hypothetical protein